MFHLWRLTNCRVFCSSVKQTLLKKASDGAGDCLSEWAVQSSCSYYSFGEEVLLSQATSLMIHYEQSTASTDCF